VSTRPDRRARRLRLECLESRLALATFHVAPTGSDAYDGSASSPWATLQKAAHSVQAGDTVNVSAGNYAGFDLWTSGTASQPIVFHAEPGTVINSRNPRTGDGINLEGASFVTIDGFKVVGMPRAGIRSVLNQNVTIRNNLTDLNGVWGIFSGFSDDLLIENNVTSRSQTQHGIYVSNSGDRPIIRNNISFGNDDCGIHMNGDLSQGGDGIISAALVEGNTIYDNGRGGGAAINADGVQGSRFQNNLLYNNHASGISLFRQDGGGGSSNNIVVNNTIVNAADSRFSLYLHGGSTGNTLLNNIFYNNHPTRGSFDVGSDSLSGLRSDYNVLMNRLLVDDVIPMNTLSQWQTATGQDRHSLVATPAQLFVNATNGDYHLVPGSPAVDMGTVQLVPSRDLAGNSRPRGAGIDIGAYEYLAGVANLPPLAVNDVFGTAAGTPIDLNVLANDSDPEGGLLTVIAFSSATAGNLVRLTNGQLRYTPQAGFSGVDSFSYSVSDGTSVSASVTVTIMVAATGTAPLVIDNGDPGFSTTASWIAHPGQGYEGDVHYAWPGNGGQAQWAATLTPGQYEIAVTWSAYMNRATNSSFTLRDGNMVLGSAMINQQLAPAGFVDRGFTWQTLGTFNVAAGNLVVVASDVANGAVIADAVRILRVGDLPTNPPPIAPQIIDNGDAGFSTAGTWIAHPGQGYQDDVHYAWPGSGSIAAWSTQLAAGQYQVAIAWTPFYNRATNAAFTVRDGNAALATTLINQQVSPVGFTDQGVSWQMLGSFNITSGELTVSTTDLANGAVIADAIRIQRIGDVPTNPPSSAIQVIDDGDLGFSTVGGWIAHPEQGHQGDVHYATAGPGSSAAQWIAVVTPGRYRIAVTWSPYFNRANNAPFMVFDGATSLGTIPVNQQSGPSDFTDRGATWKTLGTFNVASNSLSVSLGLGNSYVVADAVRIERIDDVFASSEELDELLADVLLASLLPEQLV
jgi:hypothetical protein